MFAVDPWMNPRAALSLLGSAALHVGLVAALFLSPAEARPVDRQIPDVWQGNTVEIDAVVPAGAPFGVGGPLRASPEQAPESEPEPRVAPAPPPAPDLTEAEQPSPKKPRAAPQPQPEAEPAAAPTQEASAQAHEASAQAPSPGVEGDVGSPAPGGGVTDLPAGVRHFGKAFTRAITAATHRDVAWQKHPAGVVGAFRVTIEVDEEGKLLGSATEPELVPAPLSTLLTRTLLLLRVGRFALDRGVGAGKETLHISVALSDGPPPEEATDPSQAVTLGFEPPTATREGRAYFLLGSGRRFEATVRIER